MIALPAIWKKWMIAEKTTSQGSFSASAEWSPHHQKNGSFSGDFQCVIGWVNNSKQDQESKTSAGYQGQGHQQQGHRGHRGHRRRSLPAGCKTAEKLLNIIRMLVHECRSGGADEQQQKMASPQSPHWLKSSSEGPSALRDRCWGRARPTALFIMRTHGVQSRPTHRVHAWAHSFLVSPDSQGKTENCRELRSSWIQSEQDDLQTHTCAGKQCPEAMREGKSVYAHVYASPVNQF